MVSNNFIPFYLILSVFITFSSCSSDEDSMMEQTMVEEPEMEEPEMEEPEMEAKDMNCY